MDKQWQAEEQRLWNLMIDPRWGKRKLTTHSLPAGERKDAILKAIDKNRERDFAAGWRNFEDWIRH